MENARILIVEDEYIVAKDIDNSLRGLGYIVVGRAKSGEEAIEKAEELSPHLILMDIRLRGEMNGFQAAQEIRERTNTPIVFLTAYSDKKTIEQAKNAHPYGYIIKPFAEHDLYTTIEIALHKHTMEAELAKSEKKYRDLYENAPDGYITVDASGNVTDVNKTFAEMIGLPKDKIVHGNVGQFIHETSKEHYAQLIEGIKKKVPHNNIKINLLRNNSQIVPTLIHSTIPLNESENGIASRLDVRDMSDVTKLEKEKEALQERVIRLSRKLPLTDNEKKVFLGLIAYPEYNSVELSKALKIKRSTVAAIKNRLLKEDYYRSYRVPNYHLLGCELIIIVTATLSPSEQNKTMVNTLYQELAAIPETIHLMGTGKNLLCILVSKNITEFKRQMDHLITNYKTHNIITTIDIQYFPYEISTVQNFFDFTRNLSALFDLPLPTKKRQKSGTKLKDFTKKEKRIFDALVTYSDLNDSEIASKTKLPRPSISQVRSKLSTNQLIQDVNVPSPLQLKSELIAHYSIKMPLKSSREQIETLKRRVSEFQSTYVLLSDSSEISSLHLYNDYTTFEEEHNKIASVFPNGSQNTFHYSLYPVTQLKANALQFAPLLRKILALEESVLK